MYDIAWGGPGLFASVSADGSVRVFDLRDKEHSTIIYECPQRDTPLLRLGWNKQDSRYMATIIMDQAKVVILDIRYPTCPVAELTRHQAPVTSVTTQQASPGTFSRIHASTWECRSLTVASSQAILLQPS